MNPKIKKSRTIRCKRRHVLAASRVSFGQACEMSSPPVIRPLEQNDLKAIKYQIGLSEMGPLAVANNKGSLDSCDIVI